MRRLLSLVIAAFLVSGLSVGTTAASGAVVTTFTDHVTETVTFATTDSCQGDAPVTATVSNRFVFHVTELSDGTVHVSGTSVGRFTYVPLDPTLATTTGTVRVDHFTINGALHNDVTHETFVAVGRLDGASGGERVFQEVYHLTLDPVTQEVTVTFDEIHLQCP